MLYILTRKIKRYSLENADHGNNFNFKCHRHLSNFVRILYVPSSSQQTLQKTNETTYDKTNGSRFTVERQREKKPRDRKREIINNKFTRKMIPPEYNLVKPSPSREVASTTSFHRRFRSTWGLASFFIFPGRVPLFPGLDSRPIIIGFARSDGFRARHVHVRTYARKN